MTELPFLANFDELNTLLAELHYFISNSSHNGIKNSGEQIGTCNFLETLLSAALDPQAQN